MSRRALAEKRPLLLLSVAAALAYYYLRFTGFPELFLMLVKGAAVGSLALYAFLRHGGADAKLLGWALAAAALGDMAMEFDQGIGGLLFLLFHVFAIALFMRHRRPALSPSQSWVVGVTFCLIPVIAWLLPADRAGAWQVGLYGVALGAMAASAWASSFPRYRVGAGAMLFVASDLLIFAQMGPLEGHFLPRYMVWPLYYLGVMLITTGVMDTLRKKDPELRVVN
ncbi:MAG: lysoplasmalogenase family protein [Alteraurantiacibacter sp.]